MYFPPPRLGILTPIFEFLGDFFDRLDELAQFGRFELGLTPIYQGEVPGDLQDLASKYALCFD